MIPAHPPPGQPEPEAATRKCASKQSERAFTRHRSCPQAGRPSYPRRSSHEVPQLRGRPVGTRTCVIAEALARWQADAVRARAEQDALVADLLKDLEIAAVPHGFRSSFRDWAAERTNHPRKVVQAALAHARCPSVRIPRGSRQGTRRCMRWPPRESRRTWFRGFSTRARAARSAASCPTSHAKWGRIRSTPSQSRSSDGNH